MAREHNSDNNYTFFTLRKAEEPPLKKVKREDSDEAIPSVEDQPTTPPTPTLDFSALSPVGSPKRKSALKRVTKEKDPYALASEEIDRSDSALTSAEWKEIEGYLFSMRDTPIKYPFNVPSEEIDRSDSAISEEEWLEIDNFVVKKP